ncbi:MAG: hypothetical protein HN855_11470 [Anaerolineae bacterium]|jgi:anti-sigma factor RsiW|nr:hypothetical protein [Anaerolineae bacterium]MBT7069840.1 hypothetical protein [Anaerolineae bacterium]MBT7325772.1 hypothetical protein [Anaerolineae bacterium]
MSRQPSFRDLEKLSAYLDGELNASTQAKIETRLARDPNLRAALDDLRLSRAVLRRTPQRRAPRNFTLSPQMVAKRPPLPRLVPALNYASVLAALLFAFTFLSPFGIGDAAMSKAPMMEMAAAEAPAEEAPAPMMMDATEEPAAAEEAPMMEEAIAEDAVGESAAAPAAEAEAPIAQTPTVQTTIPEEAGVGAGEAEDVEATQEPELASEPVQEGLPATQKSLTQATMQPPMQTPVSIPDTPQNSRVQLTFVQRILLIAIVLFLLAGWFLRRATIAKWQKASK